MGVCSYAEMVCVFLQREYSTAGLHWKFLLPLLSLYWQSPEEYSAAPQSTSRQLSCSQNVSSCDAVVAPDRHHLQDHEGLREAHRGLSMFLSIILIPCITWKVVRPVQLKSYGVERSV